MTAGDAPASLGGMRAHVLLVLTAAAALLAPAGVAVAAPPPVPCGNVAGVADFNGDRYDDAVVADPLATVAGHTEAGAVYVRYGDSDGLVGEGSQVLLTQDSSLVQGEAGPAQRFGSVLALGKVDGDRCLDLVVTTAQGVGDFLGRPLVQVLFGSPNGLGHGKPALTLLASPQTVLRVAAADVAQASGNERAAVAIGLPTVKVFGEENAGAVQVIGFSSAGAVAATTTFTDATPGVPGEPQEYAGFGSAVTWGRIAGAADRYDLVVGAPGRDAGNVPSGGTVTVVHDVQVPAPAYAGEFWVGVPGSASFGDRFGGKLDFVQSGANGTLAAGLPTDLGNGRGSVKLFTSAGSGLVPGVLLSQDTPGVEGVSEAGDQFGCSVSLAEGKLAVGVCSDDLGALNGAGSVQLFPLANLAADVLYSQDNVGWPGEAATGDLFGVSVGFAGGTHENALLIGVPYDTTSIGGVVDVIPLDGGTPRAWYPNDPGAIHFGELVKG